MDIGGSSYTESAVYSGSLPCLEPNPVDIGGSSYTESTVFSGSLQYLEPNPVDVRHFTSTV